MLTNSEFARVTRTPEELSPEMESFALFSLNLGDAVDNMGEPLCPSLVGKDVELWSVTPQRGLTLAEMRELAEQERIAAEKKEKAEREARIASYVAKVAAGVPLFLEDATPVADDTPETEDEEWFWFFYDDTTSGGSHGRRRGGVSDNSHFDNFVDSAQ